MALTVLIASSAAMAQSSLVIYGIVDAGIHRVSGANGHNSGVTSGGLTTSRLGFRGTEDLGGGLSAGFNLEGALNNDVGQGATQTSAFNFQRLSYLRVAGRWGEVRAGFDNTPTFFNSVFYTPFGPVGIGAAHTLEMLAGVPGGVAVGQMRGIGNTVGYFLPGDLGGFHGQVQYSFGENASNSTTRAGDYFGARLGYANGPISVAIASGKFDTNPTAAPAVPTKGVLRAHNIGGSYDFGWVKPMFVWAQERATAGGATVIQNAWVLGATAPVGVGEFRIAYSRYDRKNSSSDFSKFAIGYGHNLSKRTQLYTTYARTMNKGASKVAVSTNGLSAVGITTAGTGASGYGVGIRHFF